MGRVIIIKDVPSDQKDEVRIVNEDGGATVKVIDQGGGLFTIEATYPGGDAAGQAALAAQAAAATTARAKTAAPHIGTINREFFFSQIKRSFISSLNQRQVDGLNAILDAWEATYAAEDDRWLAYALATTALETGLKFQPIEEIGKGRDHDYGKEDSETHQTYYGRGFVQITHKGNYKKLGTEIGVDLVNHPERALDLDNATKILFIGMIKGLFTGKKLRDYFNSTAEDWVNARSIVNGHLDKANVIAGYGNNFYAAISYKK